MVSIWRVQAAFVAIATIYATSFALAQGSPVQLGVVPGNTLGTNTEAEPENRTLQTRPVQTRPSQAQPRRDAQQATRPRRPAPPPVLSAYDREVEQANSNTITLVSGTVNGSYLTLASDIAFALDEKDKLRVLPIIGRGGYENIYDVLLLKGVDVGLVRSDALEIAKREGRIKDIAQRLAYIAPLTNDEFHIVASRSITSVEQLRGKKVNFDLVGSGTDRSSRLIFERLGIDVKISNLDLATALGMVAKGELEAAVFMSPKPVRAISAVQGSANLHLLEVPYDKRVEDLYYPAIISTQDYPALVPEGQQRQTVAAKTLLVTYNWQPGTERYGRVQRFSEAFFQKFDELKKPNRHPKWQEVNLTATFNGLPRFKPAQDWLNSQTAAAASPQDDLQKQQFQQFLDQRPATSAASAPADREKLFEEFTRWQRARLQ
jgi:uncharacterized protein